MAKVKFTAVVADMRNKLNGSVFARNKGGAYVRTKVTPLNPKTSAQVAARALLTEFAQKFRSLTQAQIAAWNGAVSQWASTDVFGDIVNPSGSTLYTRLNINIRLAGGTEISTPPLPVGAALVSLVSADVVPGDEEIFLTCSPSTVPANHRLIIEATPGLSPGISNANNKLRIIGDLDSLGSTDQNIWTQYFAKFGQPLTGQKVFFRIKTINRNTGEVSQATITEVIVA